MIEQEPSCGMRTHFYHDASSYDMFRDRRVVEETKKPFETLVRRSLDFQRYRDSCVPSR